MKELNLWIYKFSKYGGGNVMFIWIKNYITIVKGAFEMLWVGLSSSERVVFLFYCLCAFGTVLIVLEEIYNFFCSES